MSIKVQKIAIEVVYVFANPTYSDQPCGLEYELIQDGRTSPLGSGSDKMENLIRDEVKEGNYVILNNRINTVVKLPDGGLLDI